MGHSAEVRILRGEVIHGPFTREQVRDLHVKGRIADADLASVQNGPWLRVADYLGTQPAPPIDNRPAPSPPLLPTLDEPTSVMPPPQRNMPDWPFLLVWCYRGCLVVGLIGVVLPWYTATSTVSAPGLGVGGSRASVTGLSIVWGLLSMLAILAGATSSFLVRKWQVHCGLAGTACGLTALAGVQLASAGPFGVNSYSSFGEAKATASAGVDWGLWVTLLSSGVAAAVAYAAGSSAARDKLGLDRLALSSRRRPALVAASVLTLLALSTVVVWITNSMRGTKDGSGSTSFFGGFGEKDRASSPTSNVTVDQLRDAIAEFMDRYAKQHPNVKDFGEVPSKDEFYSRFGNPNLVSEIGDNAYLLYRCKDGMARIECNKGIFNHYRRVYVVVIEQQS